MTAPAAGWSTPSTLRAMSVAVGAATLLVFVVALGALRSHRAAVRAIAYGAAPTIVRAEALAAHLADLDTELACALLGDADTRAMATTRFEARRHDVNREIVAASEALATTSADVEPLMRLEDELGRYLEEAGRARTAQQSGDAAGTSRALYDATQRMHERILPAAAALDRGARALLDEAYGEAAIDTTGFEAGAFVSGAILLGALLRAQVFVRRRLRRRISPGLLAATVVSAAFVAYLVGRLQGSSESLRVARDDAFDSIHALWRATALVYDARGDEARWLLDPARAHEYDVAFATKTSQLWGARVGDSLHPDDARSRSVTGLLADESRNVTFEGERAAVAETLVAYVAFLRADEGVRVLERRGAHVAALQRWAGSGDDEPRARFDALSGALQRTIDINQRGFDAAVAGSDGALRRAEWLDPAFAVAVALLAWLGVRGRLREYA